MRKVGTTTEAAATYKRKGTRFRYCTPTATHHVLASGNIQVRTLQTDIWKL